MPSATMSAAVGGTALQAVGNIAAGQSAAAAGAAKQQAANYSAASLQQQAIAARAAASQQVASEARNTQLIQGTIQARAAASGAGAVNPTVVSLEQGVAGRGEYNELSALYSGEEKARGDENQAQLDQYMGAQEAAAGKQQMISSTIKGIGSALSSGASLYAKYGMGGPPALTPDEESTLSATSPGDI